MKKTNGKKTDPRPKRRKHKDNPYSIFTTGIHTDSPSFYISFLDPEQRKQCIEISRNLFEAFDEFERNDLAQLNEADRHYELSELTEESLGRRALQKSPSVEELVQDQMLSEALHRAVDQLPETQRRRLILYYFEELTCAEIAKAEGCSHAAVSKSVSCALKNLKKYLSNQVTN